MTHERESPAPLRLLICGKMGSGKSTAADYLVDHHGAVRWSRSTAMKRLAHALVDQSEPVDPLLRELLRDPNMCASATAALIRYAASYEPEPGKPRRLYQDVAQIVMERDPLAFERDITRRIDQIDEPTSDQMILVDDVRSIASFEWFRAHDFTSLRITASREQREARMRDRDGYLPDEETFAHRSELELDQERVDHEIENDSDDPSDLFRSVDVVVEELRADLTPR